MATKDKNTKKTMGKKPAKRTLKEKRQAKKAEEVAAPGRAARSRPTRSSAAPGRANVMALLVIVSGLGATTAGR